jgi:hypothetical protein
MSRNALLQAWLLLVGLTAITSLMALVAGSADLADNAKIMVGSLFLVLALAKAHVILARYLGLAKVPSVLRGFSIVLLLYFILLAGLYVAPLLA